MINIFGVSIAATILGIVAAFYYGGWDAVFLTGVLAVLEISLSFDNAIVNASILKDMEPKWQKRFLTWGIIIAVFGMRLVFPVVLVAFATHLSSFEVLQIALHDSTEYERHLTNAHGSIAAFGGMFLLMVFLGFMLDAHRKVYWLGYIEKKISKVGALESMEVIAALLILIGLQSFIPEYERATILISGIAGVSTYVIIHGIATHMNSVYQKANIGNLAKRAGFTSFLYLEVLDASFSFDGVIGAFAISNEIVIIMIGLGIGAFFVRSLTIMFVEKKALQNYVFLEHGAHYALGALSLLMLASIHYKVPEVIIGTVGIVIILSSFASSVMYNRKQLKRKR